MVIRNLTLVKGESGVGYVCLGIQISKAATPLTDLGACLDFG